MAKTTQLVWAMLAVATSLLVGSHAADCPRYPYSAADWSTCAKGASAVCKDGQEQSPIDFQSCGSPVVMPKIDLQHWNAQDVQIKNTGYTIEVSATSDMNTTVGDDAAQGTLAQCHFHWSSEHTVDGDAYPLCVHCVHVKVDKTEERPYFVVGRFYSVGAINDIFTKLEDYPAIESVVTRSSVSLTALFEGADMISYWAYKGSLTTPGCDEAVDWKFLMSVGELSEGQLAAFERSMGDNLPSTGNFRPPQPLNARVVEGCSKECPWYPYDVEKWSTCTKGASAVCKHGQQQSPIDFQSCESPLAMPAIDLQEWQPQDVSIENTGYTLEVSTTSPMNTTVGDAQAALQQCHFHWTSEHTVQGQTYPFCVHCVHQMVDTTQARPYMVVGRFFSVGAANQVLTQLEDYPAVADVPVVRSKVSLAALFGGADMTKYWAYEGSLTTPGCAEVVDWKFLMNVGELSQAQLTALKQSMENDFASSGNFRPPQPLNGRIVRGCADMSFAIRLDMYFAHLLWASTFVVFAALRD